MTKQGRTILFQGDSITDGNRGRNDDLNHILGHGYAYIIAARLGCELPDRQLHFVNRGISGNRVSDIYARWNEDAISLRPDVISLLAGINDAGRIVRGEPGGASDRFARVYRQLLEETRETLPEAALVLCEPFVVRTAEREAHWPQWRERVDAYARIVRELAGEFGALFVPLQEAFDQASARSGEAYWVWDGVHPTAAGHHLIAERWLSVVQRSPIAIT
ncbi:SGNH/GDSL hydrolase family protein [Paenibacillus sp. IB182496]|uniref:SGNH/GDSL hydrolase family protein n=1 Tax=Paenibacillus sabuli TaxID=2772509 RepID=A0A927BZ22_9BACL|nr:SGNH/GDSL hydrolase family protein [Paenibacillus sabuli]MBD2848375.1 SGNH/GDSL hydrolase family protein [Paenibacillus sabuli]